MKHRFSYLTAALCIMGGICAEPSSPDYWKAEEYFHNSSSQKDAAADLMKYVNIKKSDTILDVGCGDGKITAEIAGKARHVCGVDISPSMIDFAKTAFPSDRYKNLKFDLKDAQSLDYSKEFDTIFSFTALQWVGSHDAFLKGAYKALKRSGTIAVTMPMGLPSTMQQAVNEMIALPEYASYFEGFSTGWNFVDDVEYQKLLEANHFAAARLAVVPQKDVFPSKEAFKQFAGQWFPYLRPLPQDLRQAFFDRVVDRFLELESPFPNGEVHFKIRRLEVVATKS